ncbi:phage tail assembly chaperone [Arthrobacter sp. FW306-07-I]|uniref:phage tail assembly chaperone n=1 Tax=Arthrobacter sp. FW306-07-I TaxID=2879622 RepID=UPI001F256700|nr:phage tail assembly chaperone [Arthrobacter sp. FW306-07-I]UKA76152.1 phage tail assembly chaperone [Arthrobacter sp. FW306-07-I]
MDMQPKDTSLIGAEYAPQLQIQLQAMEIIDEILSGTDLAEQSARESLRGHVSRWPGQPERALLAHMMTIQRTDR